MVDMSTKEQTAAYNKAYHAANRERIAAQRKAWYEVNRVSVLAKVKAYQVANRETVAARKKTWYEANRERVIGKSEDVACCIPGEKARAQTVATLPQGRSGWLFYKCGMASVMR